MIENGTKKIDIKFNVTKFKKIYLFKTIKNFIIIPVIGLLIDIMVMRFFNFINVFTEIAFSLFFCWLMISPIIAPIYYISNKGNFLMYIFRLNGDTLIIDGLYEPGGKSSPDRFFYYSIKNISSIEKCGNLIKIYGEISKIYYIKGTCYKDSHINGNIGIADVFDNLNSISQINIS